MVQFGSRDELGKVTVVPNGASTGILDAARLLIAGMRRTTGSGNPERGEVLGLAALRFSEAEETVVSASPGAGWRGGAARAYSDANRRQADHAASMAVLDRGVEALLAREADQVARRRQTLEDQATYLADLRSSAESIARIPGVGGALAASFELSAVNCALGTCGSELRQLSDEVADNAAVLQGIAQEYSTLAQPETQAPLAPDADDMPDVAAEPPARETDVHPPAPTPAWSADPAVPSATPPGPAPAIPAEAMSGLTSAFGVVGGMIGAVVTPLAAVLSGVATAAGQSMSALTTVSPQRADDAVRDEDSAADQFTDPADEPGDQPEAAGSAPVNTEDAGPDVSATESEAPPTERTDRLDPERSPAATRPPQL